MRSSTSFPNLSTDFTLRDVTTYQVGSLESAAHRALRSFKDAFLKDYGITGMQWYIIGTVYDAGEEGMRVTDLSKKLGTTLGFMTNSVNLLVSKGILERIDSLVDSRSKQVIVKPSYKDTCKDIEKKLRIELRRHIYRNISPDDLKSYIRTLRALSEVSQK